MERFCDKLVKPWKLNLHTEGQETNFFTADIIFFSMKYSMLSGSLVTTTWCVVRFWIEEMASKYGG
jgi:hypothetical protein